MDAIKKRILVVDDSQSIRRVVSMVLDREGFDVAEAADGVEAIAKVEAEHFDLVVCDFNMPNLDGLGFLKKLRQNAAKKFLPVLMLTTESEESKKEQCMEAGARAWLVKPFKPDQLISTVARMIR